MKCERRNLWAIHVEFQGHDGKYLGIVCWPDTEKTCAKIVASKKKWLTLRSGNSVNVRDEAGEWTTRRVKLIQLYRVHPTKYNDLIFAPAQNRIDETDVMAVQLK